MATTAALERSKELRNLSIEAEKRAIESFERCDTDGFISQWASQITARQYRAEAELAENGYMAIFSTLADSNGNLIPCREIETRYGAAWAIFNTFADAESFDGQIVKWVGLGDRAVKKNGYKYVNVVSLGKIVMSKGYASQAFIEPAVRSFNPDNCRIVEEKINA